MRTLIVGGGQAAAQLSHSLREEGYAGAITVVGDEPTPPYQRPPLSKAYMVGDLPEEGLILRSADFYARHDIDVRCESRVVEIVPASCLAILDDGTELPWDRLVLATGARPRPLSVPGTQFSGVHVLRTVADARVLRAALRDLPRVILIGGGFIGLEFAAVAAKAGANVAVLEADARLMRRSVLPETSAFAEAVLSEAGIRIETECVATEVVGDEGRVTAVLTSAGERLAADLVVVGIGAVPNDELARHAGLRVDDGIVVDEHLRTTDPAIFAIGDCARFPRDGVSVRLESVQNAIDQAKHVAHEIVHGAGLPYQAVPWFWSHQGPLRLQMAGLTVDGCETLRVGDIAAGRFSVLAFLDHRLIAVDSINCPSDHMAGRRLLAEGPSVTVHDARRAGFTLRDAVAALRT